MYDSTGFMSSSERLVSFLDGELSQEHTSTLFYELAQNSELQEEMRQYVLLKNTTRNSLVSPPPNLKNNILKSTGLKAGPMAALWYNGSKTAALLLALFYNRATMSVLALAFLSVVAVVIINYNSSEPKTDSAANSVNGAKELQQNQYVRIPVSESVADVNVVGNENISSKAGLYGSDQKRNKSLVSSRKRTFSNAKNQDNNGLIPDNAANIQDLASADNNALNNYYSIETSNLSYGFPIGVNSSPASRQNIYSKNNPMSMIMQNTTVYIRQFVSQSYPDFSLANENNPLLNNISIGLKYRLNSNHSIGLAGGMENFLMTFDKESDGIIYRYDQSWNGYWLALTYHYNLGEISNTGIFPELSLLGGSTVVGPILRGGLSANYYISDSFYFNFGAEVGTMLYLENQTSGSSKWFSTEKVGVTVGFGVGL